MRIEEVNPDEEGAVLVVFLQPADDMSRSPCGEGVILTTGVAVGPPVEIPQDAFLAVLRTGDDDE